MYSQATLDFMDNALTPIDDAIKVYDEHQVVLKQVLSEATELAALYNFELTEETTNIVRNDQHGIFKSLWLTTQRNTMDILQRLRKSNIQEIDEWFRINGSRLPLSLPKPIVISVCPPETVSRLVDDVVGFTHQAMTLISSGRFEEIKSFVASHDVSTWRTRMKDRREYTFTETPNVQTVKAGLRMAERLEDMLQQLASTHPPTTDVGALVRSSSLTREAVGLLRGVIELVFINTRAMHYVCTQAVKLSPT